MKKKLLCIVFILCSKVLAYSSYEQSQKEVEYSKYMQSQKTSKNSNYKKSQKAPEYSNYEQSSKLPGQSNFMQFLKRFTYTKYVQPRMGFAWYSSSGLRMHDFGGDAKGKQNNKTAMYGGLGVGII